MKLWIDAQLSPMLAKWISENFANIEATAVRDLGLRDAEDSVIFFSAREADATVLTKDNDFLELQRRLGVPPKIIWVTCGNTSNANLKEFLAKNLQQAVELLESGEILVEITG
jgi:predicted nuclease of predicted toxin-antitoxin system